MLSDLWDEIKQWIIDKIKYLFSKFRYFILLILMVVMVLLIFKLDQKNPEQVESQEIYFFGITVSNFSSWISTIAIPLTAIWAMYQYKRNLKIRKQEKSSNIAQEFSRGIVEDLSITNEVIQKSFMSKYIPGDNIDENLKYFNVIEIRELYKSDDIVTKYKSLVKDKSKEIDNIYHLILYKINNDMSEDEFTELLKDAGKNEKNWDKIEKWINKCNKPYRFLLFERNMLNQLEYLCMDISSKAADSIFIYQSLHQMFLKSIRNLYFEISVLNVNSVDKFYTNIISVYNEWKGIYKANLKTEKKRNKKRHEESNFEIGKI